jgi:hypothetical protein
MGANDRLPGSAERHSLIAETVKELPSALAEIANDAWHHKSSSALHVIKTVGEAAVAGVVLGHFIPARGPAALLVGGALTLPLVYNGIARVVRANKQLSHAGANESKIAHSLAKDTLSGAGDFVLSLGAGVGGTEAGHATAKSSGLIGDIGQTSQRLILKGENETLAAGARVMRSLAPADPLPPAGGLASVRTSMRWPGGFATPDIEATVAAAGPKLEPELKSGLWRHLGFLDRRIDQYSKEKQVVNRQLGKLIDPTEEFKIYTGSLHGHSRYSDGMRTPAELYARAKAEGEQVTTITDHNHPLSRTGVGKDDPRAGDEAKSPIITADPTQYARTFADAAAATEDGRFVALVGVEVGTIGKPGTPHHGPVGTNHFGLLEVPTFYESVVERRSRFDSLIMSPLRRLFGIAEPPPVIKPPDVVKIADGDAKAFAEHLANQKATDGGSPIIIGNHPRAKAELGSKVPDDLQFADYGKLSFDPSNPKRSIKLWFDNFAKPYMRGLELIKGEALNPDPTDKVKPGDIDLVSYMIYLDKGLKAAPVYGRDFHYGDPVGRPAGTIFLSPALDKRSILETLRERRAGATTSKERLVGSFWANDSHPMGSILDQAAVQKLDFKAKIGGEVTPESKYTVKLIGDKVGDGKLGQVIQSQELTGQELLSANKEVNFDSINHILGDSHAYMLQVDRTSPELGDYVDHMWTAPIWIEPPAGGKHSLYVRAMIGNFANLLSGAGTQQ